jgi:hypothetical protein
MFFPAILMTGAPEERHSLTQRVSAGSEIDNDRVPSGTPLTITELGVLDQPRFAGSPQKRNATG